MSHIYKPKARLSRVIGPSEIVIGSPNPSVIANMTDVASGEGVVVINNAGVNTIWVALHTGIGAGTPSGTPALTPLTGVPIPANGYLTLDNIGGLAVWGVAQTPQTATLGTRVMAGKTTV